MTDRPARPILPPALTTRPARIAHRGLSARLPENSLAAFRLAAALGVRAVELDVRCCRDATVVCHDADLARTHGIDTALSALSRAELDALFRSERERVPSLPEVFDALPPNVAVNVEIKDPDALPDVLALTPAQQARAWVSSFDHDVLARLRAASPTLPCAPLLARPLGDAAVLETLVDRLIPSAIHCSVRALDAVIVRVARAQALPVFCYTVNDAGAYRAVIEAGADGVFSDDPTVLTDAR